MTKRRIIPEREWKWFGDAGHLCVARWCQFHLCTQVDRYLVSTVGKYFPPRDCREIHAQIHDAEWLAKNRHLRGDHFDAAYMGRFGYETIGCGRTFETMVFEAGAPCAEKDCACGLPTISGLELYTDSYNDAGAATRGHMQMCRKVAHIPGGGVR